MADCFQMAPRLDRIGKYEVLDVIGRGGMGVVYKATDPHIGRFVAIKMITGGDLERFYVEAKSTGNLQCPNIVTVYDLGDQDGNPYLVMEYLEGVSLESIIASGRAMSLLEKLNVMIDVCNGLSYAHERNVIHRDIKPGNIMVLNDGTAKIVDFGIARVGDRRMTQTNQVIGSLHYMSPEQIQDRPLDAGSDIFSAGVVLYQLLTGALPFESAETAATMMKIVHEAPAPLSVYIRDYPPELEQVINRSMAKNRDERYASARDLVFDLTRIVEQQREQVVSAFFKRAQAAMQRAEWIKAREQLQQLLTIDRQNAQARRLLGEVQDKIRKQQRSEQARQLSSQANEAFVELRYDEALRFLDQALTLDELNEDLSEFRRTVHAAKERAARFQMSLRRAEAAHSVGDLDEAQQAVAEALALNPNETHAKALQHVIVKQLEEQARQLQIRQLLDEAHKLLAARKITQVFEVLKSAEALDPSALELQSLFKLAYAAREQETRKADLEKFTHLIEEAISREDYTAAAGLAETGLQKYPREQGLLKLKTFADTQQKRLEDKVFVRAQFASASALLDTGKTLEALSTVEKALQRAAGEAQLESLRGIIKERLTQEESEKHLLQTLDAARKSLAGGDFEEAVRRLESAGREFPEAHEVDELLRTAKTQLARERSVEQAMASAQKLLSEEQSLQAIELLERAAQQNPDNRVLDCLADARRQLEQFRRGLEFAVREGERILQEHGSGQAAAFLGAQPPQYAGDPHFQKLTERIRLRAAVEALDRQLEKEVAPEARVQLAEAALRKNPGNEEIEKRLATLRAWKSQIVAIAEKARDLEFSRQYEEAARQLGALRKLYPGHPHLETEILRLTKLDEQQKLLSKQASDAPVENALEAIQQRQSSTEILGAVPIASSKTGPRPLQIPQPGKTSAAAHRASTEPRDRPVVEGGHAHRRIGVLAAAAAGVIVALSVGALLYSHYLHPVPIGSASSAAPTKTVPAASPSSGGTVSIASDAKEVDTNPHASGDAILAAQREKIPSLPVQNSTTQAAPPQKLSGSPSAKPRPDVQLPSPGGTANSNSNLDPASVAPNGVNKTPSSSSPNNQAPPAPTIIASNQPSPSTQPQPRTEGNSNLATPQPNLVSNTLKSEVPSVPKPNADAEAVRSTLHSYEDAYASMDIGELQRVWPSLSKDQIKKLKEGFRGAQAVKVNLQDCNAPALGGDSAQVKCSQSMVYTRDGKRQPAQTNSVAILLKKAANGSWLVDKVQY
jgi:serine/threonine-protein kinase